MGALRSRIGFRGRLWQKPQLKKSLRNSVTCSFIMGGSGLRASGLGFSCTSAAWRDLGGLAKKIVQAFQLRFVCKNGL